MKKLFLIIAIPLIVLSLISCAARVPSARSAHSLTKGFFKSYSKKYKTSIFGKSPIKDVEINRIKEQSRRLATVEAFVNLENGILARVLLTTKRTPPFGWSVMSWEILDVR